MVVYAIFLCIQGTACRLLEPPRIDAFGYPHRTPIYRTLGECDEAILRYGVMTHDAKGRYLIGKGMWYECRHRHIDTWSPS